MPPLELTVDITPRARIDVTDVRARASTLHGGVLEEYERCLYFSYHTTAGYLPQSLAGRLTARPQGLGPYIELFRTLFPEGAGYSHDDLDRRTDLTTDQRPVEPTNGDSHLAFIAGGLHACVSYVTRRPGPVCLIDLDGVHHGKPRRRITRLVGYDREEEVARMRVEVPVSAHPIDAINLKEPRLGLYDQIGEFIERHGVGKGRIRLELPPREQHVSLTVNEYETLLMKHDLAEVLRNPLRFATEKARHIFNDPLAVPVKTIEYAKYDFVRALNQLVDALGLRESRLEGLVARLMAVPASRFLRMKRSVSLLISDAEHPGRGALIEGMYQSPILVQWRRAQRGSRVVDVTLSRFV
ncbi:MAG TPA: hypothetical protein VNK41_04710 [Vicinamibacterales bacterium]|nr:hypothetical protein [Vicinamibacterales bacterium]